MKYRISAAMVSAFMILITSSAYAQKKSDMYVGGSVGAQILNSQSNVGFVADFGYFFIDNFRGNLGLGYNHLGRGGDSVKYTTDAFIINPELSYYFKIIDKLYYTPEFGVSLGWGSETQKDVNTGISYHNPEFEWSVYLNFASFEYKPVKYLGFTVGLGSLSFGGTKVSINGTNDSRYEGVGAFNILAGCSIGAKYYF